MGAKRRTKEEILEAKKAEVLKLEEEIKKEKERAIHRREIMEIIAPISRAISKVSSVEQAEKVREALDGIIDF